MPSSVMFGARLRIFLMDPYSSGVTPCFAMISGVISMSAFIAMREV